MRVTFAALLLLAAVAAAQSSTCSGIKTASACDAESLCVWCKSAAIPSSCVPIAKAKNLPPSVFNCTKPSAPPAPVLPVEPADQCSSQKTAPACDAISTCVWCKSAAIPSSCVPEAKAKNLPPSVFNCTKPSESLYRPAPGGRVLKRCHHDVPSGTTISKHADGLLAEFPDGTSRVLPRCDTAGGTEPVFMRSKPIAPRPGSPDMYDGWLAYTAYEDPEKDTFDTFLGDFSVPDAPQQVPEQLFLFTGLQNINWIPVVDPEPQQKFDIIQPVLQYPGENGAYWSARSWYVVLDVGTVASDEIRTPSGSVIFGNMTRTGPQSWFIGSTDIKTGQTTKVNVNHPRLAKQPWAYNTLECYGCQGCGTFPTEPCKFTKLSITKQGKQVTPTWAVNPQPSHNTQCAEKPVVLSPTAVNIDFQKQ